MAEEGGHGLAALVRFHGLLEVGDGLGHGRGGHRDHGVRGDSCPYLRLGSAARVTPVIEVSDPGGMAGDHAAD